MGNIFSRIVSAGIDSIVTAIGDAIDKNVTSDEERLRLKNEMLRIANEAKQRADENSLEFEKEVTKRWQSDNDSLFTRLTRPAVVVYTYVLFGVVVLMDGNVGSFHVNPAYLPTLETILATVTIAFFGSRGVEKTAKFFRGGK